MTMIMAGHDLLQEADEVVPIRVRERVDRPGVSVPGRPLHRGVKRFSRRSEATDLRAAIGRRDRSADQSAASEALEGAGRRRSVEGHRVCERRLVGFAQLPELREQAVLQRRDAKFGTTLREQAHMDLVHPACEKAGSLPEEPWLLTGLVALHRL